MTKEKYDRFTDWFGAHPKATKLLLATDSTITYLIIAAFIALHTHYVFTKNTREMVRILVVCGCCFLGCTVLRKIIRQKRPYEVFDTKPIRRRKKSGDSFPSRHAFSIFCIGVAYFNFIPAIGIVIFVLGAVLCTARVMEGVHFPHDVILGALLGVLSTGLGYFLTSGVIQWEALFLK